MSLGIAASLASGLMAALGTSTKSLHAGNAARNGVLATPLAARLHRRSADPHDAARLRRGALLPERRGHDKVGPVSGDSHLSARASGSSRTRRARARTSSSRPLDSCAGARPPARRIASMRSAGSMDRPRRGTSHHWGTRVQVRPGVRRHRGALRRPGRDDNTRGVPLPARCPGSSAAFASRTAPTGFIRIRPSTGRPRSPIGARPDLEVPTRPWPSSTTVRRPSSVRSARSRSRDGRSSRGPELVRELTATAHRRDRPELSELGRDDRFRSALWAGVDPATERVPRVTASGTETVDVIIVGCGSAAFAAALAHRELGAGPCSCSRRRRSRFGGEPTWSHSGMRSVQTGPTSARIPPRHVRRGVRRGGHRPCPEQMKDT